MVKKTDKNETGDLYPASLEIDYPQKLDRVSSFFRILWAIPIIVVLSALDGSNVMYETGRQVSINGGSVAMGLFGATALLILFRQRYPRWWFDFALEFRRFSARVGAYVCLLTDQYPSTVEKQSVHLDIVYPDVKQDLNRWLPLVKWLLALPHFIVLMILSLGSFVAVVIAWFAILFTSRYPRGLFDYVVGVNRWSLRVAAYAFLLTTDKYPPFSLR